MCEKLSADDPLVKNAVYSSTTKTNGLEIKAGAIDGGGLSVSCSEKGGEGQCIISADGVFIVEASIAGGNPKHFKGTDKIKILSKDGKLVCKPSSQDEGQKQ